MSATSTDLIEVVRTPTFALGRLGHLGVVVFHDAASLADLDAMEKLMSELEAQHPAAALMTVVTKLKAPPTPEVRARSAQLTQRQAPRTTSVLVLSATGLGAVIFRAFMAALALVAPNIAAQRIVRTVADGVATLGEAVTGLAASPQALTAAIERFVAPRGSEPSAGRTPARG